MRVDAGEKIERNLAGERKREQKREGGREGRKDRERGR